MLAQGLIVLVGTSAAIFALGSLELVLAWRLTSSVFRLGPQVFTEKIAQTRVPLPQSDGVHEVPGGRFRFASDHEVVFIRDALVSPSTPLPIKGSVVFGRDSNSALACGRLPLCVIVFFAIWLIVWSLGGAAVVMKQDRLLDAVVSGLVTCTGLLGLAWMWRASLKLEKRRASALLVEIIDLLSKQAQ